MRVSVRGPERIAHARGIGDGVHPFADGRLITDGRGDQLTGGR